MGSNNRGVKKLAVIGAGNMGSGIAQKMATEGFDVCLVDLDDEKVGRGLKIIEETLAQGVERKLFRPAQAEQILGRVHGTSDWNDLADVDLVVEAVFEDFEVKKNVFERLDRVCPEEAILGTNTSSMSVTQLAGATRHPQRVVGLHYFFHPAKNRLVEVVAGAATDPDATRKSWALQEQLGKTPIASADASGFVVNRYFVPWLNEAVRLLDDDVADIPSIEAACKEIFGVGMGPFELMNVTGVPIALHAARTLAESFGSFYAPSERLAAQVESGENWNLEGEADPSANDTISERMLAVVFYVAAALVDEKVGSLEDTDIGARVGLRWLKGPFEMMNRYGVDRASALVGELCERWELTRPAILGAQVDAGKPFSFELVKSETVDGIAQLTVNRPDAMNALNESVALQLHAAFNKAAADPDVRGIVIAGAGKAFIAGADIRFFVRNIEAGNIDRIVEFTKAGHALLADIDKCEKPVVARLHGLTLGGGLELALACDHIVASPRASMAFPETGIGIYPGLGGTQRTPRRVGQGLARWLIYTGQMLGAAEAAAIGLIDKVVPHDSLDDAIRELISAGASAAANDDREAKHKALATLFGEHDLESLLSGKVDTGDDADCARALKQVGFKAPIALRLADTLIGQADSVSLEQGLEQELSHLTEIFGSADAYEGLSSLGKRRPTFKGE